MFTRISVMLALAAVLSACSVAPSQPTPSAAALAEQRKAFCLDLRNGLPATDPVFALRGKVKTSGFDAHTHEIAQFGKLRAYHEYFVEANTTTGANCGYFAFYQMSRAEYQPAIMGYLVTLKNGKTFQTRTNIPFAYRYPDARNSFMVLVGGLDDEKDSWFWYISNDPRFKDPREISLNPLQIAVLEVY